MTNKINNPVLRKLYNYKDFLKNYKTIKLTKSDMDTLIFKSKKFNQRMVDNTTRAALDKVKPLRNKGDHMIVTSKILDKSRKMFIDMNSRINDAGKLTEREINIITHNQVVKSRTEWDKANPRPIQELIRGIRSFLMDIGDFIQRAFNAIIDTVKRLITGIVKPIMQLVGKAYRYISKKIQNDMDNMGLSIMEQTREEDLKSLWEDSKLLLMFFGLSLSSLIIASVVDNFARKKAKIDPQFVSRFNFIKSYNIITEQSINTGSLLSNAVSFFVWPFEKTYKKSIIKLDNVINASDESITTSDVLYGIFATFGATMLITSLVSLVAWVVKAAPLMKI